MTSLADLTAVDLLDGYRTRRFSPVDVMAAVLKRVARWEPHLHALYLPDPDRAVAQARASEARWMDGTARALEGVPVTIKENVATAGDPMPLGTAGRAPSRPAEDAPAAARLKDAGAAVFAKTTMPDYGMLSSSLSSFHPLTRNPWNLSRTPGGSSSGAGAAAAAGYGPLHVGTDIGGSVRLPASWCGIVALKPSFGRVPVDPPYWGRVVGPMTRTVADAALAMRELCRPDGRDGMSLPPADLAFRGEPSSLKGLRVGLLLDIGVGQAVDPEVAAVVERAARRLAGEGARVEPVPPFLTRPMLDGLDAFWRQRAWADLSALDEAARGRVLPYIRTWAEGARDFDGLTVFRGVSQIGAIRDATLAGTRPFDLVLSPVAPCTAFRAERASPLDDPARPFEHVTFTVPFNFSEQPAISVPAGTSSEGLPIGVQMVGRRFDDEGVLGAAAAFELLRDPLPPWPAPPE